MNLWSTPSTATILLFNSDKRISEFLPKFPISLDNVNSVDEGRKLIKKKKYRMLIIDSEKAGNQFKSFLSDIRDVTGAPLFLITTKVNEMPKNFRIGIDEFLYKPYCENELYSRLSIMVSRIQEKKIITPIKLRTITIDQLERQLTVMGNNIPLSNKEFELMVLFAQNIGQAFTKKQLYSLICGHEYGYNPNNIMVYISNLRKKIEPQLDTPYYIQTVRGVGYRLNKDA